VSVTTTRYSRAHKRWRRAFMALLAGVFSGVMLLGLANPAVAQTEEDLPFTVNVNVRTGGEGVEGVTVAVSGRGFEGEGQTDENGRVALGVPDKDGAWTVTVDAESLPEGTEAPEGFEFSRDVTFGAGSSVAANFTLEAAERATTSFWDQFASRAVNGLNFGLMLALAAIGASLVFGTTGLSNFAHGEMVTFGALAAFLFAVGLDLPIWVAIPLAVVVSVSRMMARRGRCGAGFIRTVLGRMRSTSGHA
jgi:branched-chain amino acid transport system permease protein